MKNTILLFLAFTCSVQFVNGQSDDATWEESIDWLNAKLKEGGAYQFSKDKRKNTYHFNYLGQIKGTLNAGRDVFTYKGNLYDAEKVVNITFGVICNLNIIKFNSKSVERSFRGRVVKDNKLDVCTNDPKAAIQVKKVLTRLIKLAKERKAAQHSAN